MTLERSDAHHKFRQIKENITKINEKLVHQTEK
jgi:hypothetical protein